MMELLRLRRWRLQFANDGLRMAIAMPVARSGVRRHCENRWRSTARAWSGSRGASSTGCRAARCPEILGEGRQAGLQKLVSSLELERRQDVPCSLRRGGATLHYRRFNNTRRAFIMGLWQDAKEVGLYISGGLQSVLQNARGPVELDRFRRLAAALDHDLF
ncbi:unnamed protein product [Prorocentrum cordatum]|uniref:Uncharacterized protein n=1 Tax=Prorocentrum cordatum TaxID=2364126 RepID=A0ABN9S898_9DINO|nr:unnamed protein product [Polarella glacialis]